MVKEMRKLLPLLLSLLQPILNLLEPRECDQGDEGNH